jgi:enoyl-CoA hydratase/carnithine racemase
VLILKGAGGKAFVAGTDISQFTTFQDPDDGIRYEERIDRVLDRLERVTKATIAQVQGVAAGGGCGIALTCDLRIATPESSFGIPVARTLGNCLSGATYGRLIDILGPSLVKDLLLTGRFVSGSEALALRMINRLEPAEAIDAAVHECATAIAANAPLTVRATKEMVRRITAARRLPSGADRDIVTMCYTSQDFREGVEAFVAKRRPRWTGR